MHQVSHRQNGHPPWTCNIWHVKSEMKMTRIQYIARHSVGLVIRTRHKTIQRKFLNSANYQVLYKKQCKLVDHIMFFSLTAQEKHSSSWSGLALSRLGTVCSHVCIYPLLTQEDVEEGNSLLLSVGSGTKFNAKFCLSRGRGCTR